MPLTYAQQQDLDFANRRPLVARGIAPVISTATSALGTAALIGRGRHLEAAGMLPVAATAYMGGRKIEDNERAGIAQTVPVNPAFAIGGTMLALGAAGAAAALTPGNKLQTFLMAAPFSIPAAAIGRSIALTMAYKKLKAQAEGEGQQPWYPGQEAKQASKQASGPMFDFITELPTPGGKFPASDVEMDFVMKHPVVTTFKPYQLGGAAAGVGIAKATGHHPVAGAALGYAAGTVPEAMMRYKHLLELKKKMEM